jgi:hypothetical protein
MTTFQILALKKSMARIELGLGLEVRQLTEGKLALSRKIDTLAAEIQVSISLVDLSMNMFNHSV